MSGVAADRDPAHRRWRCCLGWRASHLQAANRRQPQPEFWSHRL